jgi:hypothetical protein
MRFKDQARRWVERVFPGQPEAKQVIQRSKSAQVEESERSKSTAQRGGEQWRSSAGSLRRRSDAEWSKRPITRRARRNRQPDGDSENPGRISFRGGGQHHGGEKCCPLTQAPVEAAARVAWVASRTKRAMARAEVKMSAKMEALALLARPNQGERFTPRRAWSALRLSA